MSHMPYVQWLILKVYSCNFSISYENNLSWPQKGVIIEKVIEKIIKIIPVILASFDNGIKYVR